MPHASAIRTASAVGAETATSRGAPIIAAFCTISIEIRLVSTTRPWRALAPVAGQDAGQLVERVVATDILAKRNQAALGFVEAGGMHCARLVVQHLEGGERLDRGHDLVRGEDAALADFWRRPHRLGQTFDAAQAAARRPCHLAAPAQKLGGLGRLQPDPELDADLLLHNVDGVDRIDRRDHALGQAEAYGEVLEVLRRRHHHRVGSGVEGEGDRSLLGDRARALDAAGGAPDRAGNADDRLRHGRLLPTCDWSGSYS